MANFDMAELALKSVCPNNAMKYDDREMPSVMVFIPKFRLCDVLSTADTSVHPAFRVNGVEIDGFWVGKYQTSHYNGRAYSLPGENPANTASLDTFVSYHLAVELEKKYYRKTTAQELDVELEWLRNLVRMAADKDLCGAKFAPPLSMHQYETWARYNTEIGCLLGKYIASVKK